MTTEFKEAVKALSAARREARRAATIAAIARGRWRDAEKEQERTRRQAIEAAKTVMEAVVIALGNPTGINQIVAQARGVVIVYWNDCITTTWKAHLKRAGQEVT